MNYSFSQAFFSILPGGRKGGKRKRKGGWPNSVNRNPTQFARRGPGLTAGKGEEGGRGKGEAFPLQHVALRVRARPRGKGKEKKGKKEEKRGKMSTISHAHGLARERKGGEKKGEAVSQPANLSHEEKKGKGKAANSLCCME